MAVGNTGKKVSVKKLCSLRITSESFINGIVTDEKAFTDELSSIWKKYELPYSNISLVLNSSQFISKTVSVQSNMTRRLKELIRNEFIGTEQLKSPLYENRIYNKYGNRVYSVATAVNEDYIKSLGGLFKTAGMTFTAVTTPIYAAMSFFESVPELRERTYIAQVYDDSLMMSFLIVNGKYYYSLGGRVFSEQGSSEFASEVSRETASMMKFHLTERIERKIESVYLFGFAKSTETALRESIASVTGITPSLLPASSAISLPSGKNIITAETCPEADIGSCLFAIGNLFS